VTFGKTRRPICSGADMATPPGVSPHGEERALARVSNHEYVPILRDAAERPLLRMRNYLDGAILP
jgi:hypothetical protein